MSSGRWWVATTTVRSAGKNPPRVSSSVRIRRPSAASRCSVGSSSNTVGIVEISARASSSRLRCPAETAAAPPASTVDKPSGKASSQSPRPTRSRTLCNSWSVASPRATKRLSRTVVANRCASSAKKAAREGVSSGSRPARVISNVVLPEPLGPVTATRAPGSRSTAGTGGRRESVSSASISAFKRRAASRERTSCTVAPGNAVVASKADSGNNIKMASVVGATAGDSETAATRAPRTLAPIAAVGAAAASAAGAAARSSARPHSRCWRSASASTSWSRPPTRSSGA